MFRMKIEKCIAQRHTNRILPHVSKNKKYIKQLYHSLFRHKLPGHYVSNILQRIESNHFNISDYFLFFCLQI
jgi:hypothetical protein